MSDLGDIFPGATQDGENVIIPKAALLTLTARPVNEGDAIVAGMLLALRNHYQAPVVGEAAPIVVEPMLPFWDYWTNPPSQVWGLSVLMRQATEAPPFRADRMAGQSFSADPVLLGRGGGAIALALLPLAIQRSRGGGPVAVALVATMPQRGRGGGPVKGGKRGDAATFYAIARALGSRITLRDATISLKRVGGSRSSALALLRDL